MSELFRVTDRWGRTIVLTELRWSSHIVAQHSEFAGQSPTIVADTLTAPALVNEDRLYPNREAFYRTSPLPPPWDALLIRVVVEFGAIGEVVTAHLIKRPHHKETRRWP
jgi:hypothetical protein